mmetsp:Transcript_31562/g.67761  ORF Transcript_31562/g.67761 Transcript_31562/m.67761 type:complete len:82 (+) Transcript_31562:55-300(+)
MGTSLTITGGTEIIIACLLPGKLQQLTCAKRTIFRKLLAEQKVSIDSAADPIVRCRCQIGSPVREKCVEDKVWSAGSGNDS